MLPLSDYHEKTPLLFCGDVEGNRLYMKRDDLFPFSFGGNKARKCFGFFADLQKGGYDTVLTYGSSSSNLCRVAANLARSLGLACEIISPVEQEEDTFNSQLRVMFGAGVTFCPVSDVSATIERRLAELRAEGHKPYFIPGGGHGNIGTHAYVECYEEICAAESERGIHFDDIFHASGTGTTQAGLIAGSILSGQRRHIVGISIARKAERGRHVVVDSVLDYLMARGCEVSRALVEELTEFDDSSTGGGYGAKGVGATICDVMERFGVPLDETYTGKAYFGMLKYLREREIRCHDILFIHTGGTPLFFDYLLWSRS